MSDAEPLVLVAGTTCDYVDWIRRSRPGKSLFITRRYMRDSSDFESPAPAEEIIIDDDSPDCVYRLLSDHCRRYNQRICGVAGYDCESLLLVAFLAAQLHLPFPAADAILNCRQKLRAVIKWRNAELTSPRAAAVTSADDAVSFFNSSLSGAVVLKPQTGSGSEHTYKCTSQKEVRACYGYADLALRRRCNEPIFRTCDGGTNGVLAVDFAAGTEYSCDFYVPPNAALPVRITRLCRKYPLPDGPFGTTGAYEPLFAADWPVEPGKLSLFLSRAAAAVGLSGIICMADIIVQDGIPQLLEMAARPAGDCLLWTMNYMRNLDSVVLVHDLAAGRFDALDKAITLSCRMNEHTHQADRKIALRIFAGRSGVIDSIDTSTLVSDPRVCSSSLMLSAGSGHTVVMPPDDYDSRILGHVVYIPDTTHSIEEQNEALRSKITVRWR